MESKSGNDNIDNKLFQNSIKYLYRISNIKALNVPALKSFYSTKGRLMELRNAIYLPSNITRKSVRCHRCFINLLDGPASYKIKAQQKKTKFAKRVLAKSHHNKPLTQFQKKYLKKIDGFNGNQLAITCKFCKKESVIKLEKPKKLIHPKVTKESSQKKKKLKKKDKFSGLNEDAVRSIISQNIRNLDSSKLNEKESLIRKKVHVTKEIVKESMMKLDKKNKKLNKLGQLLNSSNANRPEFTIESSQKKKNLKKKDKFCGLNEKALGSITPQNMRNLDSSNSFVGSVRKSSGFRLNKKESLKRKKVHLTKENIKENMIKLKKKNKKLDKLSHILNSSNTSKGKSTSKLKHFLESL